MPITKRIWKLNGIRPLSVPPILEVAEQYGWPIDWSGIVNGLSCPRGRRYGEGNFLVSSATLEELPTDTPFDITCETELGTLTFKGYMTIHSKAVTKNENPAHWVVLADRRFALSRVATEGNRYNLRKSRTEFVEGTDGNSWQDVLEDLWDLLPEDLAGDCPTLENPPSSEPENLIFDSMKAWDAINQVLTAVGHIVVLDPFTGKFSFVDGRADQVGLAGKRQMQKQRLIWDYRPKKLPETNRYSQVNVAFHLLPGEDNDSLPFKPEPKIIKKAISGASLDDTSYPILDTMFAWDGRTALDARALEISNALDGLMRPWKEPWADVYSGCLDFKPGQEVTSVLWLSDGENGMETHVAFTDVEIRWPRKEFDLGGGGGTIQGELKALDDGTGVFAGLKIGTILIKVAPCDRANLIGEEIEVVDHSKCVFDLPFEDLEDVWVWAEEGIAQAQNSSSLTDCHWTAQDRCCVDADFGGL